MIDVAACERIAALPGNPYAGVLKGLCARIRELEPPPPVEPPPVEVAPPPPAPVAVPCRADPRCEYPVDGDDGRCTPHRRMHDRRRERMRAAILNGAVHWHYRMCLVHQDRRAVDTIDDVDGSPEYACELCVAQDAEMAMETP